MSQTLQERLRKIAAHCTCSTCEQQREAADALDARDAEIARLREALREEAMFCDSDTWICNLCEVESDDLYTFTHDPTCPLTGAPS